MCRRLQKVARRCTSHAQIPEVSMKAVMLQLERSPDLKEIGFYMIMQAGKQDMTRSIQCMPRPRLA